MKKIWILILSLGIIGTAVYFAYKYLFYQVSLRGVVPAVKFPGSDIKQYLPQDSRLGYPLSIAGGYTIDVFANLDGNLPRDLEFDPSGTLIASATNKGKVLALPDTDGNEKADEVITILSGLNRPHGIAFYEDWIYIAETDKVARYAYNPSDYSVGPKEPLFSLPGGGRHFTRTIKIHNSKLYISVGSSCDVCIEEDWRRASILVADLDGGNLKTFAKGLRNTVFFAFDAQGNMWGTDMGRDNLGDDLPPDEVNLIQEGKDYGWPYCYGNRVRDSKFKAGELLSYCTNTEPLAYALPAHVAPLGLAFIDSVDFSVNDKGNMLVSLHGSWNRSEPIGYEIIKLSIFANSVTNSEAFIKGWLKENDVMGRPVDLVFGKNGKLFISDDYSGLIYILKKSG